MKVSDQIATLSSIGAAPCQVWARGERGSTDLRLSRRLSLSTKPKEEQMNFNSGREYRNKWRETGRRGGMGDASEECPISGLKPDCSLV